MYEIRRQLGLFPFNFPYYNILNKTDKLVPATHDSILLNENTHLLHAFANTLQPSFLLAPKQ